MGRGNDAIPTWSGFNYQGKMMLLHVLELINQIERNNDKRIYAVELEKRKIFVLSVIHNTGLFIKLKRVCLKINGIVIVKLWTSYCSIGLLPVILQQNAI